MASGDKMNLRIGNEGRDWLTADLVIENDAIEKAVLKGSGCSTFLLKLDALREHLKGPIAELEVPTGTDHADMLMRELVLRIKGEWEFPYQEEELCHCRMVPSKVVDAAIINGADTIADICRRTNAGTGCGTCRPNSEAIISYRKFGKKA